MASDKDTMMSTANYHSGLIAAAKNSCADAFVRMNDPIREIEEFWKGSSGDLMVQHLYSIKQELLKLHGRLEAVEAQMKNQASVLYNEWPESENL